MRGKIRILLGLGILFLFCTSARGDESGQIPQLTPRTEKVLHYTASRLGLPILKATIRIEDHSRGEARSFLQIQALFQSLQYLNPLFRMNNRFTSTMETETCAPVRYVRDVDQDGLLIQKKNYVHTIFFDSGLQRVVVEKKEKHDREVLSVPPSTYDPLSMFARCYLKGEIDPGQDLRMSIYDGVKVRQMVFHSKREKVKSKIYGTVEAVRLESAASFSTFGDKEGIIRIWYLAEGERIPLLMELDLPVGKVKFELEAVEEGSSR